MINLRNHWAWLIALGLLTVAVGLFAGVVALQDSLRFEICLSLILTGLIHAVHSFWSRPWGGFYSQFFGAIPYLLIGLMLLAQRGQGTLMLTLLLSALFIMQGLVQLTLVSKLHPYMSRGWMLVNGVVAVLLGASIWVQWPNPAYWMIGLLVGIHLLFRGVSITALGLAIRRVEYNDLRRLYSTAARSGETIQSLVCRRRIEAREDAKLSV